MANDAYIRDREAAQADENRHLAALIGQSAAGVAETDLEGGFIQVNDRYCAMVGRSRDELLGMRMQDITHPDDLPRNMELFRKAVETGEPFEVEKRYLCPDGDTVVWVNNTVSLIRDPEGRLASMLAVSVDITDRKRTETALKESEERFRAMADSAPSPTWVTNPDGVEFVNRAFCEFTGLSAHELMGNAWTRLIHADDLPSVLERRTKAWETGESYGFEARFRAADGNWRTMRTSSRPRFGPDGDLLGYVGMATDVTDIRVAETALKESEARFRNMADHAPVMMWVTEPDGRCSYLNKAWYEFTGQDEEQALGFGWLQAVHPDDSAEAERTFLAANEKHQGFQLEYRLRRHDGAYRWAIDAASPRFGPAGQFAGYIGSVIDIHERKREEGLRDARNRVLELAVEGRPLAETLEQLVRIIEEESGGEVLGSILLLDRERRHLLHGAAPSLPDEYNQAIHGIEIGPGVGSCGTAADAGTPVFVADIANDPLWKDFKELAAEHGLRACWSIPILGSSDQVLGTFAMYYRQPREPADGDLQLVDYVTRTASLVIERHQASQKLRERSDEFYALADNIPALAWMARADGHIFWYNRRWYEYTGASAESQEGWGWESVHHPDTLPDVKRRWTHSIATGQPFEMTFPLRGWDGVFRPFLTRIVPIRDDKGEVVRWFGTNVDVSDQQRIQQALQEESRTLETLNRTGAAIASELDLEKVVQLVTDAGVELTGAEFGAFFYNVTNANGESFMLYTLSGAERSDFEQYPMPRNTEVFGPTFEGTGIVRSDDITRDRRYGKNAPYHGMPEGHLPVRSYLAVPVRGRSGEVIGGLFFGHPQPARFEARHERLMTGIAAQAAIAIDNAQLYREAQREIENRMKAEQAVRLLNETLESRVAEEVERRSRSEEALQQLQKMETVGQLSGGIAHDFNNLLQVIHGNLSLIQKAAGDSDPKIKRWTGNALLGAERAASLTQRLLAFSRRQPLAPRAVDANRLIEGMAELLHRTLGETIELQTDLEGGLWLAEVDPNQLENAILNLTVNARDAMSDGGRLTIETSNCPIDDDLAGREPDARPGDYVCISVSDEGIGMDAETLERAIEPFFTTKDVGKGTGLGLPMVYGFAQQSGGYLRVYSETGVGTSAKIYLPRHAGPGEHVEEERPDDAIQAGRGETILLCEDDAEVRSFSSETLRELGYEVIEAADAAEALAALAEDGEIDLLFTDVILPGGMTGADLADHAQGLRPELKILYTSGYARSALDHQGRLEPGVDLILKPFSVSDLAARLRMLLDRQGEGRR